MENLTPEEIRKKKNDEGLARLEGLERKYGPEWAGICVEIEELERAVIEDERTICGMVEGDPSEFVDESETFPGDLDFEDLL